MRVTELEYRPANGDLAAYVEVSAVLERKLSPGSYRRLPQDARDAINLTDMIRAGLGKRTGGKPSGVGAAGALETAHKLAVWICRLPARELAAVEAVMEGR